MKLYKDWTLAHSLYYFFFFGYWLAIVSIVSNIILLPLLNDMFHPFISWGPFNISVLISPFSGLEVIDIDNFKIRVYAKTESIIYFDGPINENISAYIFYTGIHLISWLAILFSFYFSSKLFKNLANEDYFNSINFRYLFYTGWTLFIISLIFFILSLISAPFIDPTQLPDNVKLGRLQIDNNNRFILAFICFVLGYVFKEASRIHQEHKLTV